MGISVISKLDLGSIYSSGPVATTVISKLDLSIHPFFFILPGPTSGLTPIVFKEVMAMHLFLPSLVCKQVVGQRVGTLEMK